MANVDHEPVTGISGISPSRALGQGVRGLCPLKLKTFQLQWMPKGSILCILQYLSQAPNVTAPLKTRRICINLKNLLQKLG